MNADTVSLLERMLSEKGPEIVDEFYDQLLAPEHVLPSIFRNTDLAKQKEHLLQSLIDMLHMIDNEPKLTSYLNNLGIRHLCYEVEEHHYDLVGQVLEGALAVFSEPYQRGVDWSTFTNIITTHMRRGAQRALSMDHQAEL